MPIRMTDIEQRIMGVLIEKALTQPGSYPLTINAIVLGANQKQNRDPVVEYSEADVARAVHTMQVKGLVKQAPPSSGARANRFQHHVVEVFHWDRREQAIMAELLLRGKQTAGELRTRAERMTTLPDLEAVNLVLHALSGAQTSYVEELPREPGRSANRWRHLLGEEGAHVVAHVAPAPSASHNEPHVPSMAATSPAPMHRLGGDAELSSRVQALEARVAILEKLMREHSEPSETLPRP